MVSHMLLLLYSAIITIIKKGITIINSRGEEVGFHFSEQKPGNGFIAVAGGSKPSAQDWSGHVETAKNQ